MTNPNMKENLKAKVFFDGQCHLCANEIKIYRKQDVNHKFEFVDITSSNFNAEAEGLDGNRVHQVFHLKTADGEILEGVEAFRLIWKQLPKWNWAYRASEPRFVRKILNLGYHCFLKIRPYLPKRKSPLKI